MTCWKDLDWLRVFISSRIPSNLWDSFGFKSNSLFNADYIQRKMITNELWFLCHSLRKREGELSGFSWGMTEVEATPQVRGLRLENWYYCWEQFNISRDCHQEVDEKNIGEWQRGPFDSRWALFQSLYPWLPWPPWLPPLKNITILWWCGPIYYRIEITSIVFARMRGMKQSLTSSAPWSEPWSKRIPFKRLDLPAPRPPIPKND